MRLLLPSELEEGPPHEHVWNYWWKDGKLVGWRCYCDTTKPLAIPDLQKGNQSMTKAELIKATEDCPSDAEIVCQGPLGWFKPDRVEIRTTVTIETKIPLTLIADQVVSVWLTNEE